MLGLASWFVVAESLRKDQALPIFMICTQIAYDLVE
jgi:hypothetical protein